MINEREIVLNILVEQESKGINRQSLIQDALSQVDYLTTQQKGFINRICQGTIERQIQIDYILNLFSKTKTPKMERIVRNTLRMSVYQIMFMDAVPDSAAVNEAVKLIGKKHMHGLKGFVNGVLRTVVRNKNEIKWPDKKANSGIDYLSVYYSMPAWICKKWIETYGFDKTKEILSAFMNVRPTIIRIDERLTEAEQEELVNEIKAYNDGQVKVQKNNLLPYAYELSKTDNIRYLPGFEEGKWIVQDTSSMLVGEIAGIKPGNTVIDVCSAPGGKTLHAASKLKNTGEVLARDLTENKCALIRENIYRMNYENVSVEQFDASEHDDSLENRADVLLCDLPCSGLGIIGRKSDIKYNVTPESLESVVKLQKKILNTVWNYVKEGGTMMYSTCTINSDENEKMVEWICENLPFERVSIIDDVPEDLRKVETLGEGYIQLMPGEYGTDGFFIAKLRRKNSGR